MFNDMFRSHLAPEYVRFILTKYTVMRVITLTTGIKKTKEKKK